MKKFCILLLSLLPLAGLQAQFGVSGSYHVHTADQWQIRLPDGSQGEPLLGDGWSAGVDYWFRLKKIRIEFLPGLNYGRFRASTGIGATQTTVNHLSLFMNTNIYLFDLKGDCDCPTFSKQGPTLQKGLFLQLSPGLTYARHILEFRDESSADPDLRDDALAPSIGAALGFDLGLSDLITLTPLAGLRYFPSVRWEGLAQPAGSGKSFLIEDDTSGIWQTWAGLRIGIRIRR